MVRDFRRAERGMQGLGTARRSASSAGPHSWTICAEPSAEPNPRIAGRAGGTRETGS
jgi:hypothetical protein